MSNWVGHLEVPMGLPANQGVDVCTKGRKIQLAHISRGLAELDWRTRLTYDRGIGPKMGCGFPGLVRRTDKLGTRLFGALNHDHPNRLASEL